MKAQHTQERMATRAAVFDSLQQQIAVIDDTGSIIDVNYAWICFGAENNLSPEFSSIGSNYLDIVRYSHFMGDQLAVQALQGILTVINCTSPHFYYEYPCHSPNQQRWFIMRVSPLQDGPKRLFVIAHYDITERKLAEEKAESLSLHDPLTGLANRRYFNEFLHEEIRRCIRNQLSISLVMIDVDNFKGYNDHFGHLAGDECLIKVSQVLSSFASRPNDLAARLGGDEFAVIFGGIGNAYAQTAADSLREKISGLNLVFGREKLVTISAGIVSVDLLKHQSEETLLHEADKALYCAKSAGRNRVIHTQLDN
ncbi:GGDEF domain-containing protein [Methylovulum psychrotolerans]|uniref:diguanylate cyclase n=2 Tax=Methylovulum psychrotolerans TaxID=1704499 RepID=A0A2S5CRU9_9GAMM|nr:GGDEF domain-containing protein [Methylovulum psychrotolerans]